MRVRLYRPIHQRRARCLLGIALLLPAAGFMQAAGLNSVTIFASAILVLGFATVVIMALRPVATLLRSGMIITGSLGQSATIIAWDEIVRIEPTGDVVSITTRRKMVFQIQIDLRAVGFLSRMVGRTLSVRGTGPRARPL